jgi:hypothetical protein
MLYQLGQVALAGVGPVLSRQVGNKHQADARNLTPGIEKGILLLHGHLCGMAGFVSDLASRKAYRLASVPVHGPGGRRMEQSIG